MVSSRSWPQSNENENVSIEFDHMRVRTPLLSVKKLVRDDHEIGGGNIKNTTNGKHINFFEHASVQYVKLKTTPPVDSKNNDSGVGRQEA